MQPPSHQTEPQDAEQDIKPEIEAGDQPSLVEQLRKVLGVDESVSQEEVVQHVERLVSKMQRIEHLVSSPMKSTGDRLTLPLIVEDSPPEASTSNRLELPSQTDSGWRPSWLTNWG